MSSNFTCKVSPLALWMFPRWSQKSNEINGIYGKFTLKSVSKSSGLYYADPFLFLDLGRVTVRLNFGLSCRKSLNVAML